MFPPSLAANIGYTAIVTVLASVMGSNPLDGRLVRLTWLGVLKPFGFSLLDIKMDIESVVTLRRGSVCVYSLRG